MDRVTNNLIRNDFLYTMNRQQNEMNQVQQEIASQRKSILPEDDPVAVVEIMSQKSHLSDIERYERNIDLSKGKLDLTESSVREVNELLQRARELAIQGSNGIYKKEDQQKIAVEINQILEQVVQIANSKYKGDSLFGGTKTNEEAFKVTTGKIINPVTGEMDWGETSITKVDYQGDIGKSYAEVGRGEYLSLNLPGNQAFWSGNQTLVSGTPGTGFTAGRDQTIRVDGVEIKIKLGDNLKTVADKINASNINVRAEIDNTSGQNLMILRSTVPHQIWLEDINGGTVLKDLGIIDNPNARPPYNYSSSAAVHSSSVFDVLIDLRDSLYRGDTEKINSSIGSIDQSIDTISRNTAQIGSIQKRIENTQNRLSAGKLYATEVINNLEGLDMAEAFSRMKSLETEYNAALQIGARIMPKTLLDYLR